MLTIIEILTFDILPLFCMLGGVCWFLVPRVELNDEEDYYLEVELARLKEEVAEEDALVGLDSYQCLFADMDDFDMELSQISVNLETGEPVVLIEAPIEETCCIELSDEDIQADTISGADTKVAGLDTMEEATDLDISGMVTDLNNWDVLPVGSDESTFWGVSLSDDLDSFIPADKMNTVVD